VEAGDVANVEEQVPHNVRRCRLRHLQAGAKPEQYCILIFLHPHRWSACYCTYCKGTVSPENICMKMVPIGTAYWGHMKLDFQNI
jgi:hypothetical protein